MKKFEYDLTTDSPISAGLNEMGQEGWELCAVTEDAKGNHIYYWKRELPSEIKQETK